MHRIAIGQIRSTSVVADNLATCVRLMQQAAEGGARMLFLPEATDYISESKEMGLSLAQPLEGGDFVDTLCAGARRHSLWLSVGIHERIAEEPQRLFNTHLVISSEGLISARYRKLHLFDIDIAGGPRLMESEGVKRGDEFCAPVASAIGRIGLSTCYDVRFPELSLMQRNHGAEILTFPSAFTVKTGQAHWGMRCNCKFQLHCTLN